MKIFHLKIYILVLAVVSADSTIAQKNMDHKTKVENTKSHESVIIGDSLAAHIDQLDLQIGMYWLRKVQKWQFGDFIIVANKMEHKKGSTTNNLFNTKTKKVTNKKFSMVISHNVFDTTTVLVEDSSFVRARQEAEFFHETIGWEELLQESRYFRAIITLQQDKNERWTLLMKSTGGSQVVADDEAFLTNGQRNIKINWAGSGEYINFSNPELFVLPKNAKGFNFTEFGKFLCAFQYSGPYDAPCNMAWIDNRLDAKMKILLTAAMAAILQNKRLYNYLDRVEDP